MPDLTPVVYVVDDDFLVRECLEALIYEAGWRPSAFASAEAFLSQPRRLCPSCLVLDVMLPGLSGLDLQQRIAGDRANIPIIFVTGSSDVPITVRTSGRRLAGSPGDVTMVLTSPSRPSDQVSHALEFTQ